MAEPDPAPVSASSTLRRTARRRADLYRALIATEQALARPASGREDAWLEAVRQALDGVAAEIEAHVEITEGPDGLYDEIAATAPRLTNALDALRDEHVEMRSRVREEVARLTARDADPETVDSTRADLARLLGFLVKHRQRGSDLVWQAYGLDIGGVG